MKYFIDAFWPREPQASGREFALWYHAGKVNKTKKISIGDRVLLYETGKHPEHPAWKGAQTIFASVTVVGELVRVQEGVASVGGRLWDLKIPFKVDFIVDRNNGVDWDTIKAILNWRPKATFRSGPREIESSKFLTIENELKGIYDERDYFMSDVPSDTNAYLEGQRKVKSHWAHERNRKVVAEAKRQFKKKHGKLYCTACGFSFEEKYGDLGVNIIDAHHITPLSDIEKERVTRIEDLALLCSNCHRIIHSKQPSYDLALIKKAANQKK